MNSADTDLAKTERYKMVKYQIEGRGIHDHRILDAMRKIPRHRFIPDSIKVNVFEAYDDKPVHIGFRQTISQPYIVAYMTELLALKGNEKILEVGTGSGYQTAVLAEIAKSVYSIEIVPELCEIAKSNLSKMDYPNIHLRCGDGYFGWPEESPFDIIIVTAAPSKIPGLLKTQLKKGGKMIVPIGKEEQFLLILEKTEDGFREIWKDPVRFVPMTGEILDK